MNHSIFGPLPLYPKFVQLAVTDSTNNEAKRILERDNKPHATVVLADHQTAGRGLTGNSWLGNPAENLYMSIVLETDMPLEDQYLLNICVALALFNMMDEDDPELKIKWPNDIYFRNKKIAGTLIENTVTGNKIRTSIIGIGINVNQLSFDDSLNATSLALMKGMRTNVGDLAYFFIDHFNPVLYNASVNPEEVKQEFLENMLFYRKAATFEAEGRRFTAVVEGVDRWGRLLLNESGTMHSFAMKEVKLIW